MKGNERRSRASAPPAGWKLIQGDTFAVKDELKALGGFWDPQMRGWWLPPDAYDDARNLVDNCEGQMGFGTEL